MDVELKGLSLRNMPDEAEEMFQKIKAIVQENLLDDDYPKDKKDLRKILIEIAIEPNDINPYQPEVHIIMGHRLPKMTGTTVPAAIRQGELHFVDYPKDTSMFPQKGKVLDIASGQSEDD
jgi:hypothetical protein